MITDLANTPTMSTTPTMLTMDTTPTISTIDNRRIVRARPHIPVRRSIVDTQLPIVHERPPTRVEKRTSGDVFDGTSNKKRRECQLSDEWRVRNYMRDLIYKILKEKRPHASEEWNDKIPKIAEALDDVLYCASEKFADYANPSTLKARIQTLALSVRDNANEALQNPNSGSTSGGSCSSSSGGSCSSSGGSCSSSGSDTDISGIEQILQNLHLEKESTQEGLIQSREEGVGAREEGEDEDEEGDY